MHVPSLFVDPVSPLVAEALLNPYPRLQVFVDIRLHFVAPGVFLYLPAAHGVQAPSFAEAPIRSEPADALEKAKPALQVLSYGDDMSWQASVPVVALYFPAAHGVHAPSFDVAPSSPPLYCCPGGQVVTSMSMQAVVPPVDLNLPAGHNVHAPSSDLDP